MNAPATQRGGLYYRGQHHPKMPPVLSTVAWFEKAIPGVASHVSQHSLEKAFLDGHDCAGAAHVWRKRGAKNAAKFGPYSTRMVHVNPASDPATGRKAFRVFWKTLNCTKCNEQFVFQLFRSQRKGEGTTNEHARGEFIVIVRAHACVFLILYALFCRNSRSG